MRSKSRTSSSKSCESRTGNLAATDASAPNFPDDSPDDFPDPSAADEDEGEGSFPGGVSTGEKPKAPNDAQLCGSSWRLAIGPCDVPLSARVKSAPMGLNADVNEASEPKLPSNTRPFSPVLAPVEMAREERPSVVVTVVVTVVGVGVGGVNVVGGVSKVSHPAVRLARSSSIGVVTSNPSNPSNPGAHSCGSNPRRSGGFGVLGGFASARTTVVSPYRTYSVVASVSSSPSWRLAIGPTTFAVAQSGPRTRRDSRRHSTVGDMSRAGHLAKICPITRRQLETSTASCDTNAGTARDAMDPSHPDEDDDDDDDADADDLLDDDTAVAE